MLSWDAYRGAGSLGKCSWVKGLVLRQPGSQRENFKKEGTSSVCSAALGEWCWQLHVVRPGWRARQWQGCWPWACTTRVPDRWQGSVLAAIRESWGGHSAGGWPRPQRDVAETPQDVFAGCRKSTLNARVSERKLLCLVQLWEEGRCPLTLGKQATTIPAGEPEAAGAGVHVGALALGQGSASGVAHWRHRLW